MMNGDVVSTNLHNHTNASDGSDDPTLSLFNLLRYVQYGTISDHDTTDGWEGILLSSLADHLHLGHGSFTINIEELSEAFVGKYNISSSSEIQRVLGKKAVKVYHGIELTVSYQNRGVHLLGLGIDAPPPAVREHLFRLAAYRHQRLRKMVDEINAREDGIYAGINIPWDGPDGVRAFTRKSRAPSRLHTGVVLHRAGYGTSPRDSMEKYVAPLQATAFDHSYLYSAKEGIAVIREQLRGVPGLAHPKRTARHLQMGVEGLVAEFARHGAEFLDANTDEEVAEMETLAQPNNLFVTGGHDTHGMYDRGWKRGDPRVLIPRANIIRLEALLANYKRLSMLDMDEPHS